MDFLSTWTWHKISSLKTSYYKCMALWGKKSVKKSIKIIKIKWINQQKLFVLDIKSNYISLVNTSYFIFNCDQISCESFASDHHESDVHLVKSFIILQRNKQISSINNTIPNFHIKRLQFCSFECMRGWYNAFQANSIPSKGFQYSIITSTLWWMHLTVT